MCLDAKPLLEADGLKVRVVSMPSWTLFEAQDDDYQESVLPPDVATLAVEAAVLRLGPVGRRLGVHRPLRCLGAGRRRAGQVRLHPENVAERARELYDDFGDEEEG